MKTAIVAPAMLALLVVGCGTSAKSGGGAEAGTGTEVRSCADLPAAGAWQNISPPAFSEPANMETLAVVVAPDDQTVYAAAGNRTNGGDKGTGVLKSADCGATWTLASTGTNGDKLATGDPWAMLIDPAHSEVLYINNGYGTDPTLYKSTNGGVDWTELAPDPEHVTGTGAPFVQAIALDPRDGAHLAVTFHANCGAPYTPWCFSQSPDGGATWHLFNGPTSVPGFTITGWMEASSISVLGSTSYLALSPGGVYFTADGGGTWTLVVAEIDATSYAGSTHVLPDGTLYIGDSGGLVFTSAAAPGHDPPFALYEAPTLPVPTPRLPFQTGLAPAVMALANSPQVTQIIDDGVSLFGSNNLAQGASFFTAKLADPTAWTQMPDEICVGAVCRGSNELAYDSAHHIVYSASWGAGLWRLVTR
jgi:hypothetical protein